MKLPIYLDYQATTPVDPRVLDTMLPYFKEEFGNAASRSQRVRLVGRRVSRHRSQANRFAHRCFPKEIIFTSGSTEAINLAIKGLR